MTRTQSTDQRSLADRVSRSLQASLMPDQVDDTPSPHFYSVQAFDPALFDDIREALPESQHYGGVGGRTTNPRAQKSRQVLPLMQNKLEGLSLEKNKFWIEMVSFFRSADFVQLAMAAYAPLIQAVRPDLIGHQDFEIRFELLRDTTAYGIGPHSDHPKKVMTLLFYLSGGDTKENLGTSFYKPVQEGYECETGRHHRYGEFRRMKTYPYAPNAVLSFLRTNTSFHGVEVIEEENVQRDVMRWMLWKR